MSQHRYIVTYRIESNSYDEAKAIAWALQVEQTIEFPYEFVKDDYIKHEILGRLESLEQAESNSVYVQVGQRSNAVPNYKEYYIARISYHVDTTAFESTQFLNVVFGNSSLQPGIWVVDIEVTPILVESFKGPRFGLSGLRTLLDVPHRAMIQAVIKPMGTDNLTLANMCRAYAKGGVDVIKDDHGITNQPFSSFKDRVSRCADAVNTVNAETGHHTLYAANVSCDGSEVLERAYYAKSVGATALMVAPGLVGFGWLQALANDPE